MDTPRDVVFTVHPPGRGYAWLATAWAIFSRARLPWVLLLLAYYVALALIDLLPWVGELAVPLVKPVFAVGFLAAAWTQERGGTPQLADLFRGFRSNLPALLVIGVVFVVGITVAVMSTMLVDGGKLLDALTAPAEPTDAGRKAWMDTMAATLGAPRTQLAILFAAAVATPAMAAIWFAPGLVVFQDLPARAALGWSMRAAFANWKPLAVWGAFVFAAGVIVPGLVVAAAVLLVPPSIAVVVVFAALMPYAFFFAATLHVCDYVAYRDIFHAGETLAPLPAARDRAAT